MSKLETSENPRGFVDFMNKVAALAVASQLPADEVASGLVTVAADIGRSEYGDNFVDGLCKLAMARKGEPVPYQQQRI